MPARDELVKEHEEVVSGAKTLMDEAGTDPSDEQLEQLREASEKAKTLRAAIEKEDEKGGILDSLRASVDEDAKLRAARDKPVVPPIYGDSGKKDDALRTPGELFTESEAFRGWLSQFPQGGPTGQATVFSETVKISNVRAMLDMATGTDKLRSQLIQRALVTSADASAGSWVNPQYMGMMAPGLVRPFTLRQLVTVIPVTTDAVEYVKEDSRTKAAAPVAEATALTGTTGTKPEGALVFSLVTETVKTIAEWVPATKRIIADATGLRAYIDQFLMDDIAEELEDQMISGAGTGENFRGILNTSGIGDVGAIPAGGSVLDSIREAKRVVQVNGRTNPNGIVLNPADSEKVDLLKINSEVNHFVGPGPYVANQPAAIWGMTRVESEAITAGTFLVGDFRRAILFDREDTSISVGTAGDDFIRNIVRVLAEMRAAFGVVRAAAFCKGDVP